MTDYNKLRQLAEKATPGPWEADQVVDAETEYGTLRHWEVANEEFWNPGAVNDDEPEPRWIQVEHVSSKEDAEYIAAANPTVILNLLEDLRITRAERDDEKKKNLVLKQELHLHKTQMREARAIAWDAGAQAGLDWDKDYPDNIRAYNPFKESK